MNLSDKNDCPDGKSPLAQPVLNHVKIYRN